MEPRMSPDDLAWEQAEDTADTWLRQFLDPDIRETVANFVYKHNSGIFEEFRILAKGSYNIALLMQYQVGPTVIRFSQPGAVFFPEEKVANEVSTVRFLTDKTSIPVPFVLRWGRKEESPLELSPFIMMDYIKHETSMYDALNTPGCLTEERGILDPNINIDQHTLEALYREFAVNIFKLSVPSLPRIGSLQQIDDLTWDVTRRPLSMNMNELVRLGDLPRSALCDIGTTFSTTSSYLEYLAGLNIKHLIYQRNDAIDSADDCRRKYIARWLFRKLARDKRLTEPALEHGPFRMWCDDLRPANVLLNDRMQIVGVVDWEFAYAAPAEFAYTPPWWLLVERPEYWPSGIEDWATVFDDRLKTFLGLVRECEDTAMLQGRLGSDLERLSERMRRSWESGEFWVVYAVLHSFAFDAIYWRKIDPRFFGETGCSPDEAWRERLGLLDEREMEKMEALVARKVAEMEERVLAWDPDEYTVAYREDEMARRAGRERVDGWG